MSRESWAVSKELELGRVVLDTQLENLERTGSVAYFTKKR